MWISKRGDNKKHKTFCFTVQKNSLSQNSASNYLVLQCPWDWDQGVQSNQSLCVSPSNIRVWSKGVFLCRQGLYLSYCLPLNSSNSGKISLSLDPTLGSTTYRRMLGWQTQNLAKSHNPQKTTGAMLMLRRQKIMEQKKNREQMMVEDDEGWQISWPFIHKAEKKIYEITAKLLPLLKYQQVCWSAALAK